MSLYERFTDEAAFRDQFIRPLLNKMGFYLVAETHGVREFGKDFVFSELHRFGGMRHYAAQVKHEKAIRLGSAIDDLIAQINQAFTNPFTLPDSKGEAHVSGVYIFNSGKITTEAKDDMVNRLRRSNYGENVFFLDGERLESLDRWGTYQSDKELRQKLLGLRSQLILNIHIWNRVNNSYKDERAPLEARNSLLHGIEEHLSSPYLPELISPDEINILWQKARIIDAFASLTLQAHRSSKLRDEASKKKVEEECNSAIVRAVALIKRIDLALQGLKPL